MPIDEKVRKVVKDFVKSFGDGRDNAYDYPKDAGSSFEILSNGIQPENDVIFNELS